MVHSHGRFCVNSTSVDGFLSNFEVIPEFKGLSASNPRRCPAIRSNPASNVLPQTLSDEYLKSS